METVFGVDAALLSRIQFAFTISFHIVFPAFSIGLSAFIATLEVLWLGTGRQHFHRLPRFWAKIFPPSFPLGVVAGSLLGDPPGAHRAGLGPNIRNTLRPLFACRGLPALFLA